MDLDVFRLTWEEEATMLARVLVGVVAGAIVGFERRRSGKRAGVRTVALVSMGAATFTVISVWGFEAHDTARVAAQIVSGVGFLGAGTILRYRGEVLGLTTAATIWVSAALGMAAGAGLYVLALGGALIATGVTALLPHDVPGMRTTEPIAGLGDLDDVDEADDGPI
ncbi:MAG: MgtC/SapB family protein [Dehalococcoidia bacterium]|nr:MgtC/SapB family protein [Dehalococcoidia bacterium]